MNKENWQKSSKDCNVCGEPVEIGSASSRCSNRDCPTRHRSSPLSTSSDAQDVYEYFESKDTLERNTVDSAVKKAYKAFKHAGDPEVATSKQGAVQALLRLSSYDGWGDLRMEVDSGSEV